MENIHNSFDLVIFCLQNFKCKDALTVSTICLYCFFFFFFFAQRELARLNGEVTNVVHDSSFFGYFYPDLVNNVIIYSPHFSVSNFKDFSKDFLACLDFDERFTVFLSMHLYSFVSSICTSSVLFFVFVFGFL